MKSASFFALAIIFMAQSFVTKAQYTPLYTFIQSSGTNPAGTLINGDSVLYGVTQYGTFPNYDGTIYKIRPDGTGYTVLHRVDNYNHKTLGPLVLIGDTLYGMTCSDIFKMKTDGTGYAKLCDLGITITTNYGALINNNKNLYGMTNAGGEKYWGTIFKVNSDGTNFSKIFDFKLASEGIRPKSDLIFTENKLFGTTEYGGINDKGTIYKINPDGSGYTKLFDFDARPSQLLLDGSTLYGATQNLVNGSGTLYKINTDGTGYKKIIDLKNYVFSNNTILPLISFGDYLIGGASFPNHNKFIFKVKKDGSEFNILYDSLIGSFTPLLIIDSTIYGTIGESSLYTLFKYKIEESKLHSVDLKTNSTALISVYPNPAYESVKIELPRAEPTVINIVDITGRCVYNAMIFEQHNTIDVSKIPNGFYYLCIKGEKLTKIEKLLIQH